MSFVMLSQHLLQLATFYSCIELSSANEAQMFDSYARVRHARVVADLIRVWVEGQRDLDQLFENKWSDYVDVDCSIAVNSCTTGLELALKTIGISEHSVIVPNYTFCATPMSVINAGGSVVYADIDSSTLSLSLESIKNKVCIVVILLINGTC